MKIPAKAVFSKMNEKPITWLYLAIFVIVAFFIIKYVVKRIIGDKRSQEINLLTASINQKNLSFPKSQYYQFSDRLFRAMSGLGTDEQTIYSVLSQLKNIDDWKMLQVAFGTRESGSAVSRFKGTLTEWLEDELSTSEKAKVTSILNKLGASFYEGE